MGSMGTLVVPLSSVPGSAVVIRVRVVEPGKNVGPPRIILGPQIINRSGQPMSNEESKNKCRNFLSLMLELSAKQRNKQVAGNVRGLIQGLINGKVEEENFVDRLQIEINYQLESSSSVVGFLKKSLPYLRHSLVINELKLDGIIPPPLSTLVPPAPTPTMASSTVTSTPATVSAAERANDLESDSSARSNKENGESRKPKKMRLSEDTKTVPQLKEENYVLRCLLEASKNEVGLLKGIKADLQNELEMKDRQLRTLEQKLMINEQEAKLLGIISTFLVVQPFGISLFNVWSHVQKVVPLVSPNQIEVFMRKFPSLFKQEVSGIGATLEKKWVFVGYTIST